MIEMMIINTSGIKELKIRTRIHEHDFHRNRICIICLTCGLLYCEKCGKLVLRTFRSGLKLQFYSACIIITKRKRFIKCDRKASQFVIIYATPWTDIICRYFGFINKSGTPVTEIAQNEYR